MPNRNTIFIIDDEDGPRNSIAAVLGEMDADVHCFSSAEAFTEAYSGQRPAVIVTDQLMPGMSGIELLEFLRGKNIGIAIVMMTGYPDTRSTVRAVQGGALAYIVKPCSPQEILDEVAKALREDERNHVTEERVRDARERVATLSSRERDAMKFFLCGELNKVVASRLNVSLRTIETRRANILRKLGGSSLAEVVQTWLLAGEPCANDLDLDAEFPPAETPENNAAVATATNG